jgi:hypothetical protein
MEQFYGMNPTSGYKVSMGFEQNEFNSSESSLLKSTPQTITLTPSIGFSGSFNSSFTSFIRSASKVPMNIVSEFTSKIKKEPSNFAQPSHNLSAPMPIKPTVIAGEDSYYGQEKPPAIKPENPVLSKFSGNPMYTSSPAFPEQNFLPMSQTPVGTSQPMALENISNSHSGVKSNDLDDDVVPKKTIKKEKNRVSAQKCRFRKKQYIESLELRISELTAELQRCKDELQMLKGNKEQAITQQTILQEYNKRHTDSIKQLESMVAENQTEEKLCELIKTMNVKVYLTL